MVHYDGAHTYLYMIVQRTAMHQRVVPDRNHATDIGGCFKIGTMDHRAILDVGIITADLDIMHIALHHRVELERNNYHP